jgi:ferric enterobactin receptor
MMKKLIGLLISIMFTLPVFAQMPQTSGHNFPTGKIPSIGHLYGKIIDSLNNKPLEGVSVMLLQTKFDTSAHKNMEVLVKGMITGANGEFSLDNLPIMGRFKLQISYIGYNTRNIPVSYFNFKQMQQNSGSSHSMPNFDKDLGKISMGENANLLKGVTVTASVPLMQLDADKKVFNVEKNIVSAGGTAVDVMKNVPSVLVDADNNVTLRGKTPQIYIDGRPTSLTLDEIPADAIASVEIITNPSAKYDASGGGAGIINIVLKKDRKQGINGDVRAGGDSRGGFNGGADLNVRQGKFNVSVNAMGMDNHSYTTGVIDEDNFYQSPETLIHESNDNTNIGGFAFGRAEVDYFPNNNTTLYVGGLKAHGQFNPDATINTETDSLYQSGTISGVSNENSISKHDFNFGGLQAGLVQLFHKSGEKLTTDINYNKGTGANYTSYITNYYLKGNSALLSTQQQKLQGNTNISFFTYQTDYVLPTKNNGKLEAGVRASVNKTLNVSSDYILDSAGEYELVPETVDNYTNTSSVYAAYVDYSGNITPKMTYEAGLRAESSNYSGELTNTGEKFANKYPVSLFPSIFLAQKLNHNQQLQISYTRRINRPGFFQLLPFTDYSDELNITRGNPGLVPEFTNSFEMNYSKTFKNGDNILVSGYFKHSTNLITRYLQTGVDPINGDSVLINTYINANSSDDYGVEFTSQNSITKWWDATLDINIYDSKINVSNVDTLGNTPSLLSGFAKLSNNFKLGHGFTIQLSGVYQSKTNLPVNTQTGFGGGGPGMQAQSSSQGYIKGNYDVDMAVQKSFLKNNAASLTLAVNDIFRSRKFDQYSYSSYFSENYTRLTNPQLVRLTFSYHFGKMDVSLFKRKNNNAAGQGAQNATQLGGL